MTRPHLRHTKLQRERMIEALLLTIAVACLVTFMLITLWQSEVWL